MFRMCPVLKKTTFQAEKNVEKQNIPHKFLPCQQETTAIRSGLTHWSANTLLDVKHSIFFSYRLFNIPYSLIFNYSFLFDDCHCNSILEDFVQDSNFFNNNYHPCLDFVFCLKTHIFQACGLCQYLISLFSSSAVHSTLALYWSKTTKQRYHLWCWHPWGQNYAHIVN